VSPALGVVGQGRLNIKGKFRPKKIWAPRNPAERDMRDKLRQAGGQKGRGSGGRNFCPPAEAKPHRPARSEQKPAKKFSFPFRRKNPARANQKM